MACYTAIAGGTLNAALLEGPTAAIEIPDLGIVLPFRALYEDVDVPPAPPATADQ